MVASIKYCRSARMSPCLASRTLPPDRSHGALEGHARHEVAGVADIVRRARAGALLVIAHDVDDGIAAQLPGPLLQMDERGQHGPAARRGIGPAEGIGFAVGDEIA